MESKGPSQEKDDTSKLSTVAEILKAVPVYQDVVQPSAKKIGESLETVTKAVTIALAPIKALVWGYDKIEEFITTRVTEKLKNVPKEKITTPPPQIAGPAIEALRFSGHDPNLRELYANLLANAMDQDTLYNSHPSFVEILKNLSSDEAILLKYFVKENCHPVIDIKKVYTEKEKGFIILYANYSQLCKDPGFSNNNLIPNYINNLCRLGLLEIPYGAYLSAPNTYEPLENDPLPTSLKDSLENSNGNISFERKVIRITTFGSQFIENVVKDKDSLPRINFVE
jgi:hypothetical protein